MRSRVTVVAMMAAALLATACAQMRVSSHVDRAQDFSGYRTFDWGPADALPAGDPRLERSPFFQDHIQGAIERQMAAKGFERAAVDGVPDLRIHFHAVIASRLDVDELDYQRGYCPGSDCRSGVSEYEEGTLVIDLIDARTNRLVWRGWAQDSVEGVLDNEDRLVRKVEEGVRLMFDRLPSPR